jgi:hypothetical protein
MYLPKTSQAGQIFNLLHEGDKISVEELAKRFAKMKVATGYEVGEASDKHLMYNLYVRLDNKNTGCIKIIENRTTGISKIHKKLLQTWSINWSKLTKVRV